MPALSSSKNLEAKRPRGCLSLAGAATSIIFVATKHGFVATKHVFCRDKSILVVTSFVVKKICLLRQKVCHEKKKGGGGRGQTYFCRDKHTFVATITCLSQ